MNQRVGAVIILFLFLALAMNGFAQSREVPPGPDVEVLYRFVQLDGTNYQVIITRPTAPGRYPAVLLIGGLGCYSLDGLKPGEPYYELLYGLTRRGYVTMRVEKNGEGQSGGPRCDSPQSDLNLAVRRSLAGLKGLASYDFVEPSKIYIFAHSIGPLEGVRVAQQFQVRGFLAVETIGKTWMEYTQENTRRQMLLFDSAYDEVDRAVRTTEKCQHRFLIEGQTPEEVIKNAPECKNDVNTFGVSAAYLQQIAAMDLAAEWKKVDVPVLVTFGTSDPTTDAQESKYLVEMINSFHPRRASYAEFGGMGHGLDKASSPRAWLEAVRKHQHGEFDHEFLEKIATWMNRTAELSQQ